MNLYKSHTVAIYSGVIATIIGLITFTLSWNVWGFFSGPLPGYQILLFPGNLSLIYFWHPVFTEEINFWPKLFMLLCGQFVVVTCIVAILVKLKNRLAPIAS
jgi:hypothetical protein